MEAVQVSVAALGFSEGTTLLDITAKATEGLQRKTATLEWLFCFENQFLAIKPAF